MDLYGTIFPNLARSNSFGQQWRLNSACMGQAIVRLFIFFHHVSGSTVCPHGAHQVSCCTRCAPRKIEVESFWIWQGLNDQCLICRCEAHCSLEFYLLRFENTCTRCAWLQHLGIPPQWSRHAWRFAVHTPPFGTLDRASVATFTPQSRGCGWIFEPVWLGKPLVPHERHPWVPTPHWWMGLADGCGPTEQDLPSKVPRKGLALGNRDLKPQFSESLDQIRLKNALSAQFAPSALGRRHVLEPGCIRRGEAQGAQGAEGSWPMASWGS